MPEDDRNEHVENLIVTDSLTDPGGTTHTGSLDGSSGTAGVNLENTDGTVIVTTDTLHAGTDLQFADDGDGTATLNASVDTFSGSHADLVDVASDDHHAKTTSGDITHDDTQGGTASDAHHTKYALGDDVVASGTTQLASGSVTIATGVTSPGTHIDVLLDPSGMGANSADVKVAARAYWDNAASEYKVEILEDGTDVGNPYVGYEVVGH